MPVERHEQDGDEEIRQLRAEVAALSARVQNLMRLLAAQQEAAPQIREDGRAEGWRAGFAEGHAAGLSDEAPSPPASPRARHLRVVGVAVPAFAVAGRVLRHKAALGGMAAAALVAATVPAWHTTELRVGVPGGRPGPAAVAQAFNPAPGPPSSPPGHGKSPSPHPSPGSSHGHGPGSPSPGPQGTPPGHASPSPSPGATTDPGTATPAPDPDPSHTPAACTPAP